MDVDIAAEFDISVNIQFNVELNCIFINTKKLFSVFVNLLLSNRGLVVFCNFVNGRFIVASGSGKGQSCKPNNKKMRNEKTVDDFQTKF